MMTRIMLVDTEKSFLERKRVRRNELSVWRLSESDLYFAFHKDTDEALIAAMQKVLDEMKADGAYDAIMKKYDIN